MSKYYALSVNLARLGKMRTPPPPPIFLNGHSFISTHRMNWWLRHIQYFKIFLQAHSTISGDFGDHTEICKPIFCYISSYRVIVAKWPLDLFWHQGDKLLCLLALSTQDDNRPGSINCFIYWSAHCQGKPPCQSDPWSSKYVKVNLRVRVTLGLLSMSR